MSQRRAIAKRSLLLAGFAALLLAGCGRGPVSAPTATSATNAASPGFTRYSYEVVKVWPHLRNAFTQGLVFLDGHLFESTGLRGESSLRELDLETGNVLRRTEVPPEFFAEGLAILNGKLFQLTWQNHKGFIYDLASFQKTGEFAYDGEGWGLATDGKQLILSDGTSQIRFLDPATFAVKRSINVTVNGKPVLELNELEYIKGEIYANVWKTDVVVRINPDTGAVQGVVDFRGLLTPEERGADPDNVLNGIAYDAGADRLFITGKRWPKIFEVRLKPQ